MTKPFDGAVKFGPRSVMERPALAAQIGAIAADWSIIERSIELFYAFLMSRWTDQETREGFLPTHPVAFLTFDTLQTLNSRLELLRAIGEWALQHDESSALRDKLIPKIRKRAKLRNGVVHGIWGTTDAEPNALILVNTFGPRLAYVARDFERILAELDALRSEFAEFQRGVIERVRTSGWHAIEPDQRQT